jgi:molybdenum cofactor biosynthesis protein B
MSAPEHRATAPSSVRCYALTISDSRTAETDTSGRAIAELLTGAGHQLVGHAIVRDEPTAVRRVLYEQIGGGDAQVIITTGGTGITSRDSTYEAISALLDKRLDGFGELFRMISYEQVGAAAMLSRACAGTARGRAIFALPGSEAAVRLAMTKLILPELGHVVRELSR